MIKTSESFEVDYIDPSGMSDFARCPARYMFKRLMGLAKIDDNRIALDFGSDMHVALPLCYIGDSSAAVATFNDAWDKRKYGDDDEKRNKSTARASLDGFCRTHAPGICPYKIVELPIKAPTHDVISPNEIPFLIDIGGQLALAGRIDFPARWNADGTLWSADYKTTSEISPRWFDNFHNSPQAVGYTLALSQTTGERCPGMIIEAVRVSKRNVENKIGLIFVRDHQIESFVRFANSVSTSIIRCLEQKAWPKKPTGCAPYPMFGQPGRFCEFKMICDSPNWLDAVRLYKRGKPFHPFHISKEQDEQKKTMYEQK